MPAVPTILSAPPPADLRRITLRSRRLVTGDLLGQYRSAFRGTGLVFSDLRAYQPGDDVKHIHWKATARTGTVFVKSYEEDRQLRVVLAVDISASMRAPKATEAFAKALEFSALIGALTARGSDQLGLMLFGSSVESFLPPKSGRKRQLQVLSQLSSRVGAGESTDLAGALDRLSTTLRKPSIIFVLSDFVAAPFSRQLRTLSRRHDVVLAQIQTPMELLTPLGLALFRDPETGAQLVVDTSSRSVRRAWEAALQSSRSALNRLAQESGADHIVISDSATRPLVRLMRERATRGIR